MIDCDKITTMDEWDAAMRTLAKHGTTLMSAPPAKAKPKDGAKDGAKDTDAKAPAFAKADDEEDEEYDA